MKKSYFIIILLMLGLGGGHYLDLDITNLLPEIKQPEIKTTIQSVGNIHVYFCPHQNCTTPLVEVINSAEEFIHCAMFEIDLPEVQQTLLEKDEDPSIQVQVITDNDYLYEFNHSFVKTDTWGLMHNKFCIIDDKRISTGSMNPTVNGATKNNNNLLIIESNVLAQNYEDEFQEMWNGTFKKGSPVRNPNLKIGDTEIQNYFCKDDRCAEKIIAELKLAQTSIHFMTFSFTHQGIADILLLKHLDNISIRGVMEARQVTKYSVFQQLEYQGIDVIKDGNKQNLHHKVFIIDGETVITGSMNPSAGGDSRNDENVLIIKDKHLAKLFEEEFARMYEEGQSI